MNNSTEVKKIESFLHLYLGCEAIMYYGKPQQQVNMVDYDFLRYINHHGIFSDVILSLRPLSSMSEEEVKHLIELRYLKTPIELTDLKISDRDGRCNAIFNSDGNKWSNHFRFQWNNIYTEEWLYLLSKGFDIFNLHESGLCIYESDLKK